MSNLHRSLAVVLVLSACRAPAPGVRMPPDLSPPSWSRDAVMYEVNVRQFTPEGTLAALERHLPRLDSLGVDVLWLMPVQPIGLKNRKGGLGSYYSIADYRRVNPEYGSAADMRRFVDAAHARGMKVILDWVANHTAWDHPWITQHPDWYTHKANGEISFPLDQSGKETDWTDVAELNYGSAEMRRAMIADMRWWVDSMDVDGFRCDVAWGVPRDFWIDVRRELKAAEPGIFMLAETEGPEYHEAFDATYGWEYHHILNELAKGNKSMRDLDEYVQRNDRTYPDWAYRLYFTSNHDENSWQGTEFERMGANHLPAFVLSATLEQSMPLLYTGQEASMSKRLRFFEKDTVDWSGPSLASFYRAMFTLKEQQQALWNGARGGDQTRLTTDGGDKVYAYSRTRGGSTVVVAVNFGDAAADVRYEGLKQPGSYTDWFSRASVPLAGAGRLEIPAHGYRVLVR